jgi:hypothetical protein
VLVHIAWLNAREAGMIHVLKSSDVSSWAIHYMRFTQDKSHCETVAGARVCEPSLILATDRERSAFKRDLGLKRHAQGA